MNTTHTTANTGILLAAWSRDSRDNNRLPTITHYSSGAADVLERSCSQLTGGAFEDICVSEAIDLWRSHFSLVARDGAEHKFSAEFITENHRKIELFCTLSALRADDEGKSEFLILIQSADFEAAADMASAANACRDTEAALVESEERFRQMAELTGEWLWEQDPKGYYIYCSAAVYQILGYNPDHVVGRHYTELLTTQDKAEQHSYAASEQPFYSLVNHYRHKDGRLVVTESTGLPILNSAGQLLKWRGVDRDITVQKQFQDALIESEKRIRLIIESSLSAIVIMDSYGIVRDWNRQAENMFGWPRNEAIGCPLAELIIPERNRRAHREGLDKFLHGGGDQILNRVVEQTALRRNGEEFPVELSVSPLRQGNAYIFSGFINDISERKAAEQQIRQAQINLAIAHNEIDIARKIQAALLPSAPIKDDRFEAAGCCLPAAQVGGDYYDYFYRGENVLDMVIADVSGHSIGPALFMVEARSAIRANADGAVSPAVALARLNEFLYRDLDRSDFFITLFYLQYDQRQHLIRFANAGHPPPLFYCAQAKTFTRLDADGLIVGVDPTVCYEEKQLPIGAGDFVLFYTDGLTEAEREDGEFFGIEGLENALRQHCENDAETLITGLLTHLKQFSGTEVFKDDITLMILKCSQSI